MKRELQPTAPSMNRYPNMQPDAAIRLLVAVTKQSVDDYRAYEKRGLIVNGHVKQPKDRPFVEQEKCEILVDFFRPDGSMDLLIALGLLDLDGDAVRDRLGMDDQVAPAQKPTVKSDL
jgi:hypothetical protein